MINMDHELVKLGEKINLLKAFESKLDGDTLQIKGTPGCRRD